MNQTSTLPNDSVNSSQEHTAGLETEEYVLEFKIPGWLRYYRVDERWPRPCYTWPARYATRMTLAAANSLQQKYADEFPAVKTKVRHESKLPGKKKVDVEK